ncbi:MAG: pantetheine-phosphate adenylyltransferase, partial [Oscillospiraceae bacterium]|nr:pantetheine-phosphate adenylyltransferase [Oscillospiraceae bacterium]
TCFEEEYALAQIYRGLDPELDTIVLPAEPKYLHFSSTMVREMIKYHKALEDYMPSAAAKYVNQLMKG